MAQRFLGDGIYANFQGGRLNLSNEETKAELWLEGHVIEALLAFLSGVETERCMCCGHANSLLRES